VKLDDDDFALFGLAPRFAIDLPALDTQWRRLQAQVHPDRFAADGAVAQRLAMQWAVRVNEAYRRLKDPLRRAAYLCELRGEKVDAENNTAMPTDFLMQQMAWREALEEASDLPAVEALERDVRAHEQQLFDTLAATLDVRGDTADAARQVRALMFVARFRQDLARRLESLESSH
jgi:molecular chaperone HscB